MSNLDYENKVNKKNLEVVDLNEASFLIGMMDLGVGWQEQHETISKKVIRAIQMKLFLEMVL